VVRYSELLLLAITLACANQGVQSISTTRDFSECSDLDLSQAGPVSIAIVIDSSSSTEIASGSDINGNGRAGKPRIGAGTILPVGSTDPGDTILAAQVTGARSLIHSLSKPGVTFSIVSFSSSAVLWSDSTASIEALDAALDKVYAAGSTGWTQFSAGMDLATVTLKATPEGRRLVLFISESPVPKLPGPTVFDPSMKVAAEKALSSGIVFHTFGLGEAATAKPPHFLSLIASATHGEFRPIRNPERLHCDLAKAILP